MTQLIRRFAANPAGRDLIVGDIHGMVSKLQEAMLGVGFRPGVDRLFCCGDLVDRGPESEQAATDLLRQPWFFSVAGNHEEFAWRYFAGDVNPPLYGMNGGGWFMKLPEARQREIAMAFKGLPVAIELETAAGLVAIVHADLPAPTWGQCRDMLMSSAPTQQQRALSVMLWGRGRIESTCDWGPVADVRAVVHGHTPVERHTTLENVHYIDGGPWFQHKEPGRFIILDAATLREAEPPPRLDWS